MDGLYVMQNNMDYMAGMGHSMDDMEDRGMTWDRMTWMLGRQCG